MTEAQQRFLRAIAERIPTERIVEVRLFPPIRQGQQESAVAVVAVQGLEVPVTEREVSLEVTPADARGGRDVPFGDTTPNGGFSDSGPSVPRPEDRSGLRFSIVTARYCLTIKGPDRGKWEFDLVHDADAPLDAVERVVRGVAHRVGDAGDPDLLSPAEFQRAVTEPWYVTP